MEYKFYKYTEIIELRPYIEGENLEGINIGNNCTPEKGGVVSRDPENHEDQWYIAEEYFKENFIEVKENE